MNFLNVKPKFGGSEILNPDWKDAKWNVSGLFAHDDRIIEFINLLRDHFDCPNPIHSVHGCPAYAWNSGRIMGKVITTTSEIEHIMTRYVESNIGVFFTFSNSKLTKNDLDDPTCNYLLDLIANLEGEHGIIVSSDLLSDYVRKKYPHLHQTASILKSVNENGKGNLEFYRGLLDRFEKVVLHSDDGNNFELIEQLDTQRIEVLVNEQCLKDCKNRYQHSTEVANASINFRNIHAIDRLAKIESCCDSIPLKKQVYSKSKKRNCSLTLDEIKILYSLGVRHLKIQGRDMKKMMFMYDIVHYMLERNFIAPLVYKNMLQTSNTNL